MNDLAFPYSSSRPPPPLPEAARLPLRRVAKRFLRRCAQCAATDVSDVHVSRTCCQVPPIPAAGSTTASHVLPPETASGCSARCTRLQRSCSRLGNLLPAHDGLGSLCSEQFRGRNEFSAIEREAACGPCSGGGQEGGICFIRNVCMHAELSGGMFALDAQQRDLISNGTCGPECARNHSCVTAA